MKVPGLASLPADPPLAVAGDYTTEVKIDVAADATNVGVESGHHRGIEDSVGNHQCDKGALNVLRRRQNWRAELPAGNQQIGGLEHQPVAAVFESLAAKEASQEDKSKALSGTSKLVPFAMKLLMQAEKRGQMLRKQSSASARGSRDPHENSYSDNRCNRYKSN